MDKRHEFELLRALDRLYIDGAVCISWAEIYLWFNAERLAKGAYREIFDQWKELVVKCYGHSKAPELEVLTESSMLRLRRGPLAGTKEKEVALEDWTQ